MAFWGVEVKPGKPVTLSVAEPMRRLRISQATLGIGDATKKSIVQCNVGERIPMLLCVLLPNQTESCHLDLEFEEADSVVFSVIGPRSVYLTGYHIRGSLSSNPQSDTESFGEDIAHSETEGSGCCSEDDSYEDSFINDDEPEVETSSPATSSNGLNEITPENVNYIRGKKLKKKYQVIESDDESESHENEDDDGYLLSVFKSKRAVKNSKDDGEKVANVTAEMGDKKSKKDGQCNTKSKEKVDPVMKVIVTNGDLTTEKVTRKNRDTYSRNQKLPSGNETEQKQSHEQTNTRKKRRKCSEEKGQNGSCDREDNEASIDMIPGVKLVDSHSENVKRSKKRRKEIQSEGTQAEDMADHRVVEHAKSEKDFLSADRTAKDLPSTNGDQKQQTDKLHEKKHKIKREKKSLGKGNLIVTDNPENKSMKHKDQTAYSKPMHKRTLSNGLVIEDLANGAPDAKVADHGKKVKIYYTAMLKDNGHIFDSNVGKTACKFRLGNEEIIDGWNVGINGMHVGDKRRLTIPPSMGFGKHQLGENIPPNSWLVYDIELVGVYK